MLRPHAILVLCIAATPASGQWARFVEAPERLDAPASVVTADPDEKDYAWGDLDRDGDVDLVVARKEPFTTAGRRANVLLVNEDGVLTDRTAALASASDIEGDEGFLTPTNDRDVALVDVDGDGWLDVVTAPTLSDGLGKHLSHPRVYMNRGEADGVWLGLRYEDARIPLMHAVAGPRFAAVSAGDVTGDGAPDLFFSDYDTGGTMIFDFNDRLLVNDGKGFFVDETAARLAPDMTVSDFGIRNAIVDANGDGLNDIVRLTALTVPQHIGIAYNDPDHVGQFTDYDTIYTLSGYDFGTGDLNGDGRLDVVVADDGTDRFLLNQGNDPSGFADFTMFALPIETSVVNAGDVAIADLDRDGWPDLIMTDVDVDIPGCNHRTFVFRNQGDPPSVTFEEEGFVIPEAELEGVHDVAVMDLDGDGWLDLVLGRCTGTQVWMNVPPAGVAFTYPDGRPDFVAPGATHILRVDLAPIGGVEIAPAGVSLLASVGGGDFSVTPMTALGAGHYEAALPAAACAESVRYYLSVETTGDGPFTDPAGAPVSTHRSIGGVGTSVLLRDDMEGDVSAWSITSVDLVSGEWEAADPVGTISGVETAAPGDDATGGGSAFVTENGERGGTAGAADVDGGPTHLHSPVFDLTGTDAVIRYARWFFSSEQDALVTEISNDGGATWTLVNQTDGTDQHWEAVSFVAGDFITPSATVQVRFTASDELAAPDSSIVEAGIDDFEVRAVVCEPVACPADLDGSGDVGFADLLAVLAAWGPCAGCVADLDGDGAVGFVDALTVLAAWGTCG